MNHNTKLDHDFYFERCEVVWYIIRLLVLLLLWEKCSVFAVWGISVGLWTFVSYLFFAVVSAVGI